MTKLWLARHAGALLGVGVGERQAEAGRETQATSFLGFPAELVAKDKQTDNPLRSPLPQCSHLLQPLR